MSKKARDYPAQSYSSLRPHPSSFSRWRNAILGTTLVLGGLSAAAVTLLARQSDNYTLAAIAAILSLVSAALMLVFVVPPLARSARVEVRRFDFPIEVTSGGAIFILILVVVGFAAWNTGNNLLFMIFSLLASSLFVGGIAARASLRDLIVSARFPDHIFAGEAAPVIVTLRNAKRALPSFSILVEARGPSAPTNKTRRRLGARFVKRPLAYFTYIPRRAAAEQRVEQLFENRGHLLINGFELSTRFPFGFFRFRRRLRARDVDIVVYPKPELIGDELHLLPTYAGRMASVRRGVGQDLFSLRDYQPQDDLRHIDWKATARSRNLTVREFTAEDERRITIVLDTRDLSASDKENFLARFEAGVVQAASLLKHFVDERAEVRLMLGEDLGRYGNGLKHLYDCLRRLALVSPQAQNGEPELAPTANDAMTHKDENVFDEDYAIVLTTAPLGSIPAKIWRASHVIHV
ncbi:MAG TPA: DUF58 domain-containing protein [Pyrinomonadaceae bacterium]|jgi:uncharacterized protein (DUF58 family)|nr:DUF58 domain-containing protein [Pyrinomonadaceae bacterium]